MKLANNLNSQFQHHHAFLLIIVAIGLFFGGNVLAYSALDRSVEQIDESASRNPSVIVKTIEERPDEPQVEIVNSVEQHKATLQEFVDSTPVTSGVWLQDLSTGDWVGVNESVTFEAASMYKLFVAYEIFKQIDLGIYSLEDEIDTEDGPRSISYCLEASINVSDNPCGRALRKLANADVQPLPSLADEGFVSTALVNSYPTTNAKDVALLLEKVYRADGLSSDSAGRFMEHLKSQTVDNRIPAGLPDSVEVAHKTGDLEGYSHDGGIIISPKGDYILVIMSGPWTNGYNDAPPLIAEFVDKLYSSIN